MVQTVPLVVLDWEGVERGQPLTALHEASAFRERLEALGPVVDWGVPETEGPSAKAALRERMTAHGANALLFVEAGQLFLDTDLVRRGLTLFDPERHDVFTQWEHCRLPVGVGARAVSASTWLELDTDSPMQAYDLVRDQPRGRKFAYDTQQRVSYEESRLDTRFGPALGAALEVCPPTEWNLAGFLAWSEFNAGGAVPYAPRGAAARVDERLMPAAYGFESAACAVFPTYVMFDITNVCNAACIHCPQSIRAEDGGRPEFLGAREHQTLEAFQRVIDECTEHDVRFVRITADGEPLVHPHLFDMLEYARDRGVGPVGLTTNGSLVKEAQAERLLDSGLAMVDFSLDAVREETFQQIRVGLRYDRVRENVLRFLELRDARGADVKVVVSFVKQEANAGEVDEFRAAWEPLVDEVVVREMISNVGLNEPSQNLWPGWDQRWPCAHFFRRVVINHRGELKACPIDWEQKTVNAPISAQGVFEQWHGDFYWSHRMQHLNDAILPSSACSECPDWAGTPWELGYEKIIARLTPQAAAS